MQTILFLCSYGGAKSVMAASYFNRLAAERELPFTAVAAAAEEPYAAVLPPVVQLLEGEGFDVQSFVPHAVAPAEVTAAARVISIDCDLAGVDVSGAALERWDDVPKVSEDLHGSADAIRRHVHKLVAELP